MNPVIGGLLQSGLSTAGNLLIDKDTMPRAVTTGVSEATLAYLGGLAGSRLGIPGYLAGTVGGYLAGGQLGDSAYNLISSTTKETEAVPVDSELAMQVLNQHLARQPVVVARR